MNRQVESIDLLLARRKDCDILWASRPMNPLLPHKLSFQSKYSRDQMIEAVLNDEAVKSAIRFVSATKQLDVNKVVHEARLMVNEMASKARLVTVRWLGVVITKALKRIFSSIHVNEYALTKMKKEMQISQVQYVYAPSHRSYLDFILLSYILFSYDMALPNIASGMDFYQMYMVGELLRETGAFYMRRSFSNDLLYKKVFQSYVTSLVKHSDRAIEFFIEGTRSRSSKSIVPKFGLLSTILESLLEGGVPDIHFVPISISYERPLEELLFVYELLGVPKPKESTFGLLQSLSILQKPYAYGRVFFNIGEPVSACSFLNMEVRKAKVLSPYTKLPSRVCEDLAYSIIDSHKKNTVLMPVNLIGLLFNERFQTCPENPYTLDSLTTDYFWCKNVLGTFDAAIHSNMSNDGCDARQEVLNTLKTHEELLVLDSSEVLRLKQRHKSTKLKGIARVKGHTLTEKTMEIAVSVINISFYLNPTLSFLTKPAMVALAIGTEGADHDSAFKRYALLRTVLSTEFALPLTENELTIKLEWEETLNTLSRLNYINIRNNNYIRGENSKLFSLLYNVLLPFVDAIYITCLVLFEWDESSDITVKAVSIEAQKRAEKAFLDGDEWGKHPYSLSLDLFSTSMSNLVLQSILVSADKRNTYRVDKIRLSFVLGQLRDLSLKRPPGSYRDAVLLSPTPPTVQAKL